MSTSTDTRTLEALRAMANRLRIHSIRATTAAGSGHPTTCLSAAEIMAALFFKVMRYDPQNPDNPYNDRFILSKGHAAPVLYAAWVEAGIITEDHLMTLRDINSDLEGHPTPRLPFVEVATGSLGQGLGAGVGLALNSRFLDRTDYKTYVLMGDGESAEGSVWEACHMAGIYSLDNLVAIVDVNRLGQSQATPLQHNLGVYKARFEAFGWEAVEVDGHNVEELLAAFDRVGSTEGKPFAIIARTLKGKGVSFAEDKDAWHGKPFKKGEETDKAIAEVQAAGTDVPEGVLPIARPQQSNGARPAAGAVPAPEYKLGDMVATREAYGTGLVKVGANNQNVVALDADTKNSTFSERFMKAYPDRFFECFIAEQNMVSVAAGLSAMKKIPFASSFAVFLGRGFDQVRMAAVSRANIKLCGSHVGVSIGEDGPSQMGLEDLALFRAIPGAVVFYPSDAVSAERAVALAAEHQGIAYIRTSRPKTPVIYSNDEAFAPGKLKVVKKSDNDLITVATAGVTLFEALEAAELLAREGIGVRVLDLFTIKPIDREGLLANAAEGGRKLLTVEDHYPEGGISEAAAAAIADTDIVLHRIAVTELPRSGSPEALVAHYGLDSASIASRIRDILRG